MVDYNPPGPQRLADGRTRFRVWAPNAETVELQLTGQDRYLAMTKDSRGFFSVVTDALQPGDHYAYRLDGGKIRPDPASRCQPEGVHGPSKLVDPTFDWVHHSWTPYSLRNTVLYELHVGTFTTEGTFDSAILHLGRLRALGITAIEIMPVAQFPGPRNWGYDGVQIYAPHPAYGGVDGLKRLVDAAHGAGLNVYLDVVYNHLGPEGNYLYDYGPYFTERYHTPWGAAVNLDGPHSDPVREYLIQNAIYWLHEYRIDGLRLDATHALLDFSANPFIQQLTAEVDEWAARHNRHVHLIAENDRRDRRLITPREAGGIGMDGVWLDELHHVLHHALTGESIGYYADYLGFPRLLKVLREGFAYTGEYSPNNKRRHGTPSADIPADRFIVCTQNHDQIGNRMLGERLSLLTDFAGLKLAAGLLLTSPYVPLLFMGEEYAETAPFLYFVSHGDPNLVEAVRKGRAAEFASFQWAGEPPDPQSEETFRRSRLDHALRDQGWHAVIYRLYGYLLRLRRETPALTNPRREDTTVTAGDEGKIVCIERRDTAPADDRLRVVLNFDLEQAGTVTLPADSAGWRKICDSSGPEWAHEDMPAVQVTAPGSVEAGQPFAVTLPPKSFAIYRRSHPDTENTAR